MGHIFGDTDDITFGSHSKAPLSPEKKSPSEKSSPLSPKKPEWKKREVSSRPHNPASSRPHRVDSPPQISGGSLSVSLQNLVESMKPSFLPPSDESNMRLILLSDTLSDDPLLLVRSADTSLIIGTGFGTLENTGITYPTFPDVRLLQTEKSHIAGWILTKQGFALDIFRVLLEMLDFPFVYATRDVIAYIRNNIKDSVFLDKCRFFELFSVGMYERKIADFSVKKAPEGLLFSRGGRTFIDKLHTGDILGEERTSSPVLSREDDMYTLSSDVRFYSGEIIEISQTRISKNPLKFTFDTFYIDGQSVGVVAGYTLKDRTELSGSGVLTFVIEEDVRTRTIVGHIFIDSRGFVHSYEMMSVHKDILKGIRHTYESTILSNSRIERGDLVATLRREITKYCYLLTGRTPVVMPIIIER